ncbi:Rieske (2Fe-2S) protein [Kordiimonas aquimaris]|uniref:Rieske (2Fe-2S) protein n=1 Tax=Kordiimonas aquimaris TaxID=707591 RepID=UPI0021D22252|nr:Rieske 2Fe-2S domain-containing protein [Kordiimonas aquimaris]
MTIPNIKPIELSELPAGPETGTHLVDIDHLPDHGGKELIYTEGDLRTSILIQKTGDIVGVFLNHCPHAGTPLNMFGHRFLDASGKYLICRTHGALFNPESGICVRGPCVGQTLRPVAHTIRSGSIYSA